MSETWERGEHPGQAEVHEPLTEQDGPIGVSREEFDRELAAMVGELRTVQIDVGSFLALSTEATNEQRLALARLVHRYRPTVKSVRCTMGGAGLPADYVLFELINAAGSVFLIGGIDPEGAVST